MLTISYNVHDLSSSPSNVVSARNQWHRLLSVRGSTSRSEWPTCMYLLAAESLQLVGGLLFTHIWQQAGK